jgi:hypothetical protein
MFMSLVACRASPPFEIVQVPEIAYLGPDARAPAPMSTAPDAGRDASSAFMLCIEPEAKDDDEEKTAEEASEFSDPSCPTRYQGRFLDTRVTQRHRDNGEHQCCYRQGRAPTNVIHPDVD